MQHKTCFVSGTEKAPNLDPQKTYLQYVYTVKCKYKWMRQRLNYHTKIVYLFELHTFYTITIG